MTSRGSKPPATRTRILFVCTANQCRSPLAEAIARQDAGTLPVDFSSAGLIAGGYPVPKTGIRVARELGLDLSEHTSAQVDLDALDRFDLVLTMTREHARELVAARPELRLRIFTLKQFARWIAADATPGLLRDRLEASTTERKVAELLGADAADDIRDPMGQSARVWRTVAREQREAIDVALASLFAADYGPVRTSTR